jgi:hypothetical protein
MPCARGNVFVGALQGAGSGLERHHPPCRIGKDLCLRIIWVPDRRGIRFKFFPRMAVRIDQEIEMQEKSGPGEAGRFPYL